MKKVISFFLLMLILIIVLPFFIVRGCSVKKYDNNNSNSIINNDDEKINVYIASEKIIKEMPLEEYVKSVVAAEMPVEFEMEALKAQAVAARTYAYARKEKMYIPKNNPHENADVCTDPAHCQAWISEENAMKKWGFFMANKNWNKIEKAVRETKGIIITYNNSVINPLFHSNSGGRTENAKDVFGSDVPYLRSVKSEGEDVTTEFKNTVSIKVEDFMNKLKSEHPEFKINSKDVLKNIKIINYTEGERVKDIKVGNLTLKGTDVRKLFSLKSANFKIEKGNVKNTIKVTTLGNGHGVGMSQWGANNLAKNGGDYEEILKYYYQGVELDTIENYGKVK